MANSIIEQAFKPSVFRAVDEVNNVQVWRKLGVMGVDVLPDASVAEHPLSIKQYTSQQIFDEAAQRDSRNGKIIQPTRIQIRAITDDAEVVSSILSYFGDEMSTFTIYSKEIMAESMCIVDVDIEQSPQRLSAVMLKITMRQTQERVMESYDPSEPQDRTTFGVRIQVLGGSTLDNVAGGLIARAQGVVSTVASGAETLYNRVRTFTGF